MSYTPQATINVIEGEIRTFTIDFADSLLPGETIVSATSNVAVWSGLDDNAPNLAVGPTTINGSLVNQVAGAAKPDGFHKGVVYSVWFHVSTSGLQQLEGYINANCTLDTAPVFPGPLNDQLGQINAMLMALPDVRRGDAMPGQGFPFFNESGYLAKVS